MHGVVGFFVIKYKTSAKNKVYWLPKTDCCGKLAAFFAGVNLIGEFSPRL